MAVKKKQRNKESDLLADLSDYIVEILSSEIKFSEDEANQIARALLDKMCHTWGGQNIYFPKGMLSI